MLCPSRRVSSRVAGVSILLGLFVLCDSGCPNDAADLNSLRFQWNVSGITVGSVSNLAWSPTFNVAYNGQSIGTYQSVCPRQYTELVMRSLDGTQMLRYVSDTSMWQPFEDFLTVKVYDCNNALLGTMVEKDFSNSRRRRYTVRSSLGIVYEFTNPSGQTIGTASFGSAWGKQIAISGPGSSKVASGSVAWAFGDGVAVTATNWTADTAVTAGRPEFVLAMLTNSLMRRLSFETASNQRDGCSQFILLGIPLLCVTQVLFSCTMVVCMRNKAMGFLGSFILMPALGLWIVIAILCLIAVLFYLPFWFVGKRCCGMCRISDTPFDLVRPIFLGYFGALQGFFQYLNEQEGCCPRCCSCSSNKVASF